MKNKIYILLFIFVAVACNKNEMISLTNKSEVIENNETILKNGVNNICGFNWADGRDNFVDGWVIPSGLSSSDDYSNVQSKANTILSAFQDVGANTVRLPINPPSVLESWWSSYKGAIDMATSKGMMVILGYWEAESSKDGLVDNTAEFWDMWQIVIDDYVGNPLVFFEVFNEPHGYSTSDLISLYNNWLSNYANVPQNRVILGGTGYSENVADIGVNFSNCLFSQHLYSWWGNYTTASEWESELANRIGNYGSRTILSEFGAPMTTGKDYTGSVNNDVEIAFIQGITNYCRNNDLASVYWPGLRDDDSYSLYTYDGSMNLTSSSGLERIQYGWGGSGSSSYYRITNRNSGKVLDVSGGATDDGGDVIQWSWNSESNQQWELIDNGDGYYRIINRNSGKALDVSGGSTDDGGNVIQWSWNGGTNQQWKLINNGDGYYQILNRNSDKALDVDGSSVDDGGTIIQWSYWGGINQQWEVTEL